MLVVGAEAVHHQTVRRTERRPHLAKLAVAADGECVAGREQVADGRLHRTAASSVHRENRRSRSENRLQERDHFGELP